MDWTTHPRMEVSQPNSDASNHAAILDSQIIRQLQEDQATKDKNSLEIKKLRRKKKTRFEKSEEVEPESSARTAPTFNSFSEKPKLELQGGNDTDTETFTLDEQKQAPSPLEPVVYVATAAVRLQNKESLIPNENDGPSNSNDAEGDPNDDDVDGDNENLSLSGFDPSRRRSSGPLTDSFKKLEPFNFGQLESIEEVFHYYFKNISG